MTAGPWGQVLHCNFVAHLGYGGEQSAEGWHVVFGGRGRKSNNRRQLAGPKVKTMGSLQAPSGPAPTFDDVWRVFQETNTRFQETDRQFKATERVMKERAAEPTASSRTCPKASVLWATGSGFLRWCKVVTR